MSVWRIAKYLPDIAPGPAPDNVPDAADKKPAVAVGVALS